MATTLVVRQADLDAMELALTRAHASLQRGTAETLDGVRTLTAGWDERSASRIAERAFASQLSGAHSELVARLQQLAADVAQVREAARQCEIRNVAILD
jgi:hypothetical protein